MGILDDLRQAAEARQTRQGVRGGDAGRDPQASALVRDRLGALERYLREFADTANAAQPLVEARYEIPGYAVLSRLRQGDYEVAGGGGSGRERPLVLRFVCRGTAVAQFGVTQRCEIELVSELLRRHGLTFRWDAPPAAGAGPSVALFSVEPCVLGSFTFESDPRHGVIRLRLHNFDSLGTRVVRLQPQDVDAALLERLGNYILRRSEAFIQLELSAAERARIRRRLAAEHFARHPPAQEGQAQGAPLSRRVFNRLLRRSTDKGRE